jgi:leucyl-tRNA synthetase
VNKDGLQYAELVFNPLPNGSKFIIHRLEDKTIYAEVDTTEKIDPLPESDEEDKGSET